MKKLLFVSLALVTALATSPAAKADAFSITYTLSNGTCTQGGTGCANQNATTNPIGASATATSGASISITGIGSFYVEGSGSTFFITGGTFTIDSLPATLIEAYVTPGAAFYQGNWSYEVTSLITQSGFYGTTQTVTDPNGKNAVFFDNLLTPGTSPYLTSDGISFLVPGLGDNPNGGPAVFNIFSNGDGLYWNEVVNGAWLIDPTGIGGDPLTMTIIDDNPVPEPSSLLMLGTGLLLMAGVLFRKLKPVTV